MPTLYPATVRSRMRSEPGICTAVAAMAMFWGHTGLATTPPEVFAATSSVGSMPAV